MRFVQAFAENCWRVRVRKEELRGLGADVEVVLEETQVGPFRQMIAGLEGEPVSVGRVQGRWV